ncbi:MAG: arsenosugar biosynthesis radical SAM protein ArsS [Desulfobacteraceae bacterium]|nr:arsenosugar biosynthesis radical SAM protein ArsS [Desulfobacteraceae bacterium]
MTCKVDGNTAESSELARGPVPAESFSQSLSDRGLRLVRGKTSVLQVNIGLLCNLSCRHCHLEAGPARRELMNDGVARLVVDYARARRFAAVDITGGAPEMNPVLPYMLESLAPLASELILRSNLSLPVWEDGNPIPDLCTENRVTIVCSFPSVNLGQFVSQRGKDVFEKLAGNLRRLNAKGYGLPGTGLRLDLVSNPTGAFLPPEQSGIEKKFRRDLERNWGIVFSNLYTFGNAPLGRFSRWLHQTGNLDSYMQKLRSSFNPCTLSGLMCRSLLSVSWDGFLYDCDFNQAAGIPLGGKKVHISEIGDIPEEGTPIGVGEHCYACTAGSGFT